MSIELTEDTYVLGPGELLSEARQARGWSVSDVAERLKLRQSLIADIEQDQFEQITNQTFVRGYLRSYSRLVDINEQQVLQAYESLGVAKEQEGEMRSYSQRRNTESNNNRLMLFSYGIVAVMVGMLLVWWVQESEFGQLMLNDEPAVQAEVVQAEPEALPELQPETTAPAAPVLAELAPVSPETPAVTELAQPSEPAPMQELVAEPAEPAEPVATEPAEKPVVETAALESEPVAEPVAQQQAEPQPEAVSEDNVASTQTAAAADIEPGRLQISFTDDCWIQIIDATGRNLVANIRGKDTPVDLVGEPPYKLVIGAPQNLQELRYGGEVKPLGQVSAGKVLRMTLPK